jgi:hypothetical protein
MELPVGPGDCFYLEVKLTRNELARKGELDYLSRCLYGGSDLNTLNEIRYIFS